jgi:pimeloyl-ACP methyl ester carboxylesterase
MPFVTVGHRRLHYAEHRSAVAADQPALVLIHGAGGNLYHWPPTLRRLPGHDVFAPDLPGHGRSPGPGCTTIAEYAAVVAAWLDHLALSPCVVAGHSMGGAIALALALGQAPQLRGLVLIATGARLRVHPDILHRVRDDPVGVGRQVVAWAYGPQATPEQKRQYLRHLLAVDREVLYGDWLACDRFDVREQLDAVSVPTLILAGTADMMTPPKWAAFLAEHIPGADLAWIEGAGHMLPLERPAEVAAAIAGFMARLGASAQR